MTREFIPGKPYRNKEADKRSNSLKLRPQRRQLNNFKNFVMPKATDEATKIEIERSVRCQEIIRTGRYRQCNY
jgi:hypothetical protein